jgi:NAD-dependent dihydropyrimidine dehydrogenase PreA subunit
MTKRLHKGVNSHSRTKFIELNRRRCQACWKCVETCPNHVLGKTILFKHRHAHIDHAEACKGCKKCVLVCPNQAILYTYIPPTLASRKGQDGHIDSNATFGS